MNNPLVDALPTATSEGVKVKSVLADNAVAIRIRHRLGTGSVKVLAASITFYSDGGTTVENGTTNFPNETGLASGVLTFGSGRFNTLGGIVDVINESADWDAMLEGGIRADVPASGDYITVTAANSQADIDSVGGYGLLLDTSVVKYHSVGISEGFRSLNGANDSGFAHVLWTAFGDATGTGTSNLVIYECDDAAKTTTTVKTGTADLVAATDTFENNAAPVHTAYGKRLVVRASTATTMTACNIQATYQTLRVKEGTLGPRSYKSSRVQAD